MNQPPNPPQYGVPPQGQYPMHPGAYAPYPPPKQGMSAGKIILIIGLACFGAVVAIGLLVGVLAVATVPRLVSAKAELELKQVTDVSRALRNLTIEPGISARMKQQPFKDAQGRELYSRAIESGHLSSDILPRLISLNNSGDERAAVGTKRLAPHNCSYTAPRAEDFLATLMSRGSDRRVVVTFNSRNWNNYPDRGVVVMWSDGEIGEWLTFEQAAADWGISAEEWADPAGKLFGIKPPFQHTYE